MSTARWVLFIALVMPYLQQPRPVGCQFDVSCPDGISFLLQIKQKIINIKRNNNEWLLELHVISVSGSSAASLCFLCMSFEYATRYSSSSSDNGWYFVAPVAFTWYEYKGMTVDDTATKSVGKLYKNIALVDATLYFVVMYLCVCAVYARCMLYCKYWIWTLKWIRV